MRRSITYELQAPLEAAHDRDLGGATTQSTVACNQ